MSKSKWFRVATEGATTDGRKIERHWIDQMAKNFSPAKYGARVWIEHMRGMLPESAFAAQGDVLGVQARTVEDGKLALFAQIQPLESLVAMNKKGQKLYTSIEVDPEFAGTGEAYLIGLAVTDNPASLGTEMLQFAASNPNANPFAARKEQPDDLFTVAEAFSLEIEDAPDSGVVDKFRSAIAGALAKFGVKSTTDDARFAAVAEGFEQLGEAFEAHVSATTAKLSAKDQTISELKSKVEKLETKYAALDNTPSTTTRPLASGGNGSAKTDC